MFWKDLKWGTGPAVSLFIDEYEVLRFDCSVPGTGHFHVANQAGACRIWMHEQEMEKQIERAIFELEKNLVFYTRQNPLPDLRNAVLKPDEVGDACSNAKRKLYEYVKFP